jgi:hypothetical protein
MRKSEDNGQAACDGGNVKNGETPETETLAPEVATLNEDHCESGATATPGSRKPKEDKCRPMTALKMVRSQRLDEQGFEKFFADPPAALVVLKGLRKLAERKVLLGHAPVRASGASQRSTRDLGRKKAPIEANGDEAQVIRAQRDKISKAEPGGENRTQTSRGA